MRGSVYAHSCELTRTQRQAVTEEECAGVSERSRCLRFTPRAGKFLADILATV
jgi:hypothetical protein